jgi:lipopolysaccharide/colanic/teichoic acid biosynthesis glycosyltransferase
MKHNKKIAVIIGSDKEKQSFTDYFEEKFYLAFFVTLEDFLAQLAKESKAFDAVFIEMNGNLDQTLQEIYPVRTHLPDAKFLLFADITDQQMMQACMKARISEVFAKPIKPEDIDKRLKHILELPIDDFFKIIPPNGSGIRVYALKRILDLLGSAFVMLAFSPLFFILSLIVFIFHKGRVIASEERTKENFGNFRLLRFTTSAKPKEPAAAANPAASKNDEQAGILNIIRGKRCQKCIDANIDCTEKLYDEEGWYCEQLFQDAKRNKSGFILPGSKVERSLLGNILHTTGLEYLPQFWNVFSGELSLVGNRPLPSHQADKYTDEPYVRRFMVPAGLTGLWWILQQKNKKVPESELVNSEIEYAQKQSPCFDFLIMMKSLPLLFVKRKS